MPHARQVARRLGVRAEQFVQQRLIDDGWTVLHTNWRGGAGELDLVVCRDGVLRFVEVKTRTAVSDLDLDTITPSKARRLVSAARAWLQAFPTDFDEMAFMAALVDPSSEPWGLTLIDNIIDE